MLKRKTNKKESLLFLSFFSLFTFLFLIFLIFMMVKTWQKRGELKSELSELKEKLAQLEKRKEFLQNQIAKVQKESFWEEKIREEGYVREGENLVVILNQASSSVSKENKSEKEIKKSFFEKIKEFFKIKY